MDSYRWEKLPYSKDMDLIVIDDNKNRRFVKDLNEYEKAIRDNPHLVTKYDLNNPNDLRIIHSAVKEINNSKNRDFTFKRILLQLRVRPNTLREWMTMPALQYDEPRDDILYLRKKKTAKKTKAKRCRCK